MSTLRITGPMYSEMIKGGAAFLQLHCDEVNDLNVFPIPDGDTGNNMLLTIQGGANSKSDSESLSDVSGNIAKHMLLSARGNSGVILSQLFAGFAEGFKGVESAGFDEIAYAYKKGIEHAYGSVINPTEGTILTVAREAGENTDIKNFENVEDALDHCIREAKKSLEHTPELLDVLKQSGVVDSGGAGLVYILEGMHSALTGKKYDSLNTSVHSGKPVVVDTDLFTEDSVLEFGYCTEVLVRLQKIKCDPATFDLNGFIEYMQSLGDSIVCIKNESIVKLHVHTMTPYKVLEYAQRFGEFLTIKIENMMLQHNEVIAHEEEKKQERKKYAVIAVANGDGITKAFKNFGADVIINGGQTMNPSAGEIISAFDEANADTVFILPNNSNIILTAKQAAELYKKADIRVIPTKNIGDCYSVLQMLDLDSDDPDRIESEMNEAMAETLTAEISRSTKTTEVFGLSVQKGEYIGIMGKKVVSADTDCLDTTTAAIDLMEIENRYSMIIIAGKDADQTLSPEIADYARRKNPDIEIYEDYGGQEIYDFILVVN